MSEAVGEILQVVALVLIAVGFAGRIYFRWRAMELRRQSFERMGKERL